MLQKVMLILILDNHKIKTNLLSYCSYIALNWMCHALNPLKQMLLHLLEWVSFPLTLLNAIFPFWISWWILTCLGSSGTCFPAVRPGPRRPSHFLTLTSSPVSCGMCWQLSVLPRLRRLSFHTTDVTTLSQVVAVLVYGVHFFLTVTRGNEQEAIEKQINHADSGLDLLQGKVWFMINPNPVFLTLWSRASLNLLVHGL